ncbi:RNA-binding protein 7-like [Macrosteles quadrilineatus]|uniref:RNA-binding protein 7-like n=1 Tax=Macrosteles quadrilineatus TaxID=74068 RepID=UPI0023E24632|nr:RNA-binding protein 7-like [Macrosteles quadrilineatus]
MMRMDRDESDERTLWCGNISDQVSDEVLYELFLQAGPLESVRRPRDPNGRPKSFAFIVFKHECSVPYALELLRGEKLFNRPLNLSGRSRLHHIPVLDTHITEFTEQEVHPPRIEERNHRDKRRSDKEKDSKEPSSWAEVNALRGQSSLNGHSMRNDLQGRSSQSRDSRNYSETQNVPGFANYEQLLQLGNQMLPMGLGMPSFAGGSMGPMGPMNLMGMMNPMGMNPMGMMSPGMYPSMQDMSGGRRNSPEKDRRNDHYEERRNRRDHPYHDKRHESQLDNRYHDDRSHRRHDRGYSSSKSSHERERRDRRSR